MIKETHAIDTRDVRKHQEMPDNRCSKHGNEREPLHEMDRRERKSHLTDPTQMPSDEYKRMIYLKRDRDRDELGAYGRGTPNESVGLGEPSYRAFYKTIWRFNGFVRVQRVSYKG